MAKSPLCQALVLQPSHHVVPLRFCMRTVHYDRSDRSQAQACPGATALIHLGDLKPMRPLDKRQSNLIAVWARGSTFRVKDKEGSKDPKSSQKMLIIKCSYC